MLQAWKEKYAPLAEEWFLAFGEFESLLSFSNLPNICSSVCIPVFDKSDKIIEVADIGHPLINNSIRVNNNLSVNNNIFIISGSNMSGKTTFLRTVGINLVLANAGSFVCAQKMTLSRFKIMTSMRVADNLNEGISTFYAELKKIKGIIDFANSNNNMIFLIDEIFKGTNSVDRFYGAKTVISKLDRLGVMGFITTHDLELCDLENQHIRIKNFSFSEHYENNQILFNYKITAGKSNTTNAKYLMEMIGIL
jgi:DNA mismatch repair ATPase MutS